MAALTDVLDGLVARLLDEHSRFGEILDPIADKLLAFCILVALVAAGRLPAWLAALIIGRDVALVGAATALQWSGRPVPIEPTRAGKYATATLVALVLLVLAGDVGAAPRPALAPWVAATGLAGGGLRDRVVGAVRADAGGGAAAGQAAGTRPLTSAVIASYEPAPLQRRPVAQW